ncbi:hypothetical protein SAMN05216175_1055 [Neptunomonas qingdaonensis]|uniref:Uncharacterized protein n=1 Tax=Neptunomonas qingdaonensis TaxID=1045558 RepID=A0A1I2QMQ3_9GAMM|nr:hypothetical protein SAMN05216175_1055 [Neptunomonas qingdaonensis]
MAGEKVRWKITRLQDARPDPLYFEFDGRVSIKRFNETLDSWLVSSDHESKDLYPDFTISVYMLDEIKIIGQAVSVFERNLV